MIAGITAATAAITPAAGAVGSVTASDETDPAPGGTEIGGGEEYRNTVSRRDATVVVSTRSELLSALSNTSSGDVVYIDDDAEIELTGDRVDIPTGVTLASGRGTNGSRGGLLYVESRTPTLVEVTNDDVRVTGLRFRGQHVGHFDPDDSVWGHNSVAVHVLGADCEIDNCELYGWTYAGVRIGQDDRQSTEIDASPHVHHCSLHDNMMSGLGYGVVVNRGRPIIEYNYLNRNRHSVAGSGRPGCSYEARYNIQGPTNLIFGFEMHNPGGEEIYVHHNTFENLETLNGNTARGVAIRGTPSTGCRIENNWFYNATDPAGHRRRSGTSVIQYQNDAGGTGWDNVTLSTNHYGEDEPAADIGHPRGAGSSRDRDVITITGRGSIAYYDFEVDGAVEKSTAYGGTINEYDTIDDSSVHGRTTEAPDSFAVAGEIVSFEATADVEVLMNGEKVDSGDL